MDWIETKVDRIKKLNFLSTSDSYNSYMLNLNFNNLIT